MSSCCAAARSGALRPFQLPPESQAVLQGHLPPDGLASARATSSQPDLLLYELSAMPAWARDRLPKHVKTLLEHRGLSIMVGASGIGKVSLPSYHSPHSKASYSAALCTALR